MPCITTDRLMLVFPSADLAGALSRYYTRNAEHFRLTAPRRAGGYHSEAQWRVRAALLHEATLTGEALHLLMIARSEPERGLLGDINVTHIIRGAFQAGYLGYGLDREATGCGLMTEALSAVVPYVFEQLGLNRIMANYLPTNERSGRVLRRLGFVVEGYARDYLELDGVWQDHILTAKVRERHAP